MLQRCPPRVPNEKIYVMLRIAIQNKGRLNEQSVALLREIGINVDEAKRKFLSKASNFPIEVLYLRDDDIPQVVANGTASLGIVGLNEVAERGFDVEVVARLGFGGCRISLAIPKGDEYAGVEYFRGKRIATSYPSILRRYLEQEGVDAELEVITGSVEIAPAAGIADAIFDIVSSGGTLVSNGLKEVERVFESEAVLRPCAARRAALPHRVGEGEPREEVCAHEHPDIGSGRGGEDTSGHAQPDGDASGGRGLVFAALGCGCGRPVGEGAAAEGLRSAALQILCG